MDKVKAFENAYLEEIQSDNSGKEKQEKKREIADFEVGDLVSVHYRIVEGSKERIQVFTGFVLQIKGSGLSRSFTVRKMSSQVGVERILPINSPFIQKLEVVKRGKVRRSKIFYLRKLKGKNLKVKERRG